MKENIAKICPYLLLSLQLREMNDLQLQKITAAEQSEM